MSGIVESYGRQMFTVSRSCLCSKVVIPFHIPHQQHLRAVSSKLTEEPLFLSSWLIPSSFLWVHVREVRMGVRDQRWRHV